MCKISYNVMHFKNTNELKGSVLFLKALIQPERRKSLRAEKSAALSWDQSPVCAAGRRHGPSLRQERTSCLAYPGQRHMSASENQPISAFLHVALSLSHGRAAGSCRQVGPSIQGRHAGTHCPDRHPGSSGSLSVGHAPIFPSQRGVRPSGSSVTCPTAGLVGVGVWVGDVCKLQV